MSLGNTSIFAILLTLGFSRNYNGELFMDSRSECLVGQENGLT